MNYGRNQEKESPLGKFFQRKFFLPGMVWTGDEMADADLLDTLGRVATTIS